MRMASGSFMNPEIVSLVKEAVRYFYQSYFSKNVVLRYLIIDLEGNASPLDLILQIRINLLNGDFSIEEN